MQVKIDLHIHSTLSACCDSENTLNNIVNMSKILDNRIIALSDHNTAGNVRAIMQIASEQDILVVPAMEITTAEEIHVLCLFADIDTAEQFSQQIYDNLPKYKLNTEFYNPQLLLDCDDNEIGRIDNLLNVATQYDIYELIEVVKSIGGIPIPAHIDRESTSLMSVFGNVPDDLGVTAIEISPNCPDELATQMREKYCVISSSDAHNLESMCGSEYYLELDEISIQALFDKLSRKI